MIRRVVIGLIAVVCLSVWAFGQSCSIQVYFTSPGAGSGAQAVLRQSIDGARDSLEIAVGGLTDGQLGDAIVRAHRRGVGVRVILAGVREGVAGGEYDKLLSAGVPVRFFSTLGLFGYRFAIVDRRIVLTGSYEWTDRAAGGSYGSLVRITCTSSSQATAAQAYFAEFDRLWAQASQGTSTSPEATSPISSVSILSVDRTSQCIYLLNSSDRPADLSGWSLNDLEGQYVFPSGTEIPPNDPYRICIDVFNPAGDVNELYLDPVDDELFLMTPEGRIIDEVVWGAIP